MGNVVAQPWGEELRPLRVRPRRRAAGRAGDARQDAARHPARPADQGRLHRRDRGRQARGLPEPELHRRLRALLCALPRARPGRGLPPLLPGERLRRQRRRGSAAAQGVRRDGGAADARRLPARLPARAAAWPSAACRAMPLPAIGSLLVLRRPDRRARLRRLDGAAEHPARAVRAGRRPAARGRRGRAARRARGAGARGAGADRAREPGRGDRARRPLPPAGARGADPGAARRPDRRARPGQDRPPRRARRRLRPRPRSRSRRGIQVPALVDGGREWHRGGRLRRSPRAASVLLVVVAERAAWVRVYQANGTVLFEKHPREGRDLLAARGDRGAADLGGQLGLGLCAGRRGAARAARQRHPGGARTCCSTRRRSPSATAWSTTCPR